MTDPVRAIDTKYRGFLFRSRLEARHAVFLDALGLGFRYEPEGFELGVGRYLPDFWLPRLRLWIEVKPEWPTPREAARCAALAAHRQERVVCLVGEPRIISLADFGEADDRWPHPVWFPQGRSHPDDPGLSIDDGGGWCWAECPACGAIDLAFMGWADRLPCRCVPKEALDDRRGDATPRLTRAVAHARAARFDGTDRWAWKIEP